MIEVESVDSLDQAVQAMSADAKFFGGGTLLMRELNYGEPGIRKLVLSRDPGLSRIDVSSTQVSIGAGVTMSMLIDNPDLDFLSSAARSIGGPAIRNMATVGGNLFAPRPYGDFTTALLALDAGIHWADGQQQSLEQFLEQPQAVNRIVASLSIERPAGGEFRYLKVTRIKPKGVALMTLAALIKRENGRVGNVRLVFGGMAPQPRRAKAAELALQGATLDESGIQRALDIATQGMAAEDDALASAWYRYEVAPVYLKRLLLQRNDS